MSKEEKSVHENGDRNPTRFVADPEYAEAYRELAIVMPLHSSAIGFQVLILSLLYTHKTIPRS